MMNKEPQIKLKYDNIKFSVGVFDK